MPTIRYDKLVRDQVPDIIRQNGQVPITAILSGPEYATRLAAKLLEETHEYLTDHTVEELADIAEVIDALLACHGISPEQLAQIKADKRRKRGGFEKRILLVEVQDE